MTFDLLTILFLLITIVGLPLRSYLKGRVGRRLFSLPVLHEYLILIFLLCLFIMHNHIAVENLGINNPDLLELAKIFVCVALIIGFDTYSLVVRLRGTVMFRENSSLSGLFFFPASRRWNRLYAIVLCIFSGIWEETFYRGLLFFLLGYLQVPMIAILLSTSILFAANHLYNGKAQVVYSFFYGWIFGVLYWLTGSLVAVMTCHIAGNLFVYLVTIPRIRKRQNIIFI